MTPAQAIEAAYAKIIAQANVLRLMYLKESEEDPISYENINIDDAYVWFIEALG